ncbi:sodium-dependent lysophosphatidylcholine symporter 1-like [Centroberyx affinis]|uniref:sodium-dependent lysophosphatidylcholine symporter 1-like n=1 Tax=Centroberyx affinis TaxID=166261 RepID=UPI003A5C4098
MLAQLRTALLEEWLRIPQRHINGLNKYAPKSKRWWAHQKSPGIPLVRRISYGIGGMPYQLTQSAKILFTQIFLLDVVQMDAFYASLILFMGRAWDAITDPIIGYMVSKSRRTRIGKLIPWIVFSLPFAIVSYIMMWVMPQDSMSLAFSFSWFFIWTCLFNLFLTCHHVPYSALNMFLGGDQKARDSATAYRMVMEMFGLLAGATIHGQIVGVYHAKKARTCSQLNYSDTSPVNLSSPALHNLTSSLTDNLQDTRRAYTVAALVLASLYFLCCLVLFLGVKEQLAPLSTLDRIQMPYLTGVKMVMRHTPYIRLIFSFLFSSLAFQMSMGNISLFCTYATGLGSYLQHIILILMVANTLSIPLWQILLGRLGKKTTLYIGLSVFAPAVAVNVCFHDNLPVFIFMSIIMGSSIGALLLIHWSMLPDVVDDFKVKNPSSKDLEPVFYSCFVFFIKFGGALSNGISTLVLHCTGFKPGACQHPPAVIMALQVLFAPVPIALLLTGMLIQCFYPINEKKRQQIQRDLYKAA